MLHRQKWARWKQIGKSVDGKQLNHRKQIRQMCRTKSRIKGATLRKKAKLRRKDTKKTREQRRRQRRAKKDRTDQQTAPKMLHL